MKDKLTKKFLNSWVRANKLVVSSSDTRLNVMTEQMNMAGKSLMKRFFQNSPNLKVFCKVKAITKPEITKNNCTPK